jgi:hypothetical protein
LVTSSLSSSQLVIPSDITIMSANSTRNLHVLKSTNLAQTRIYFPVVTGKDYLYYDKELHVLYLVSLLFSLLLLLY